MRRFIYKCMLNIDNIKQSLPEWEQKKIDHQIRKRLEEASKSWSNLSTEARELKMNQIVFDQYAAYLQIQIKTVGDEYSKLQELNKNMIHELQDPVKNLTILLSLLIRALQDGNSEFINELAYDDNLQQLKIKK